MYAEILLFSINDGILRCCKQWRPKVHEPSDATGGSGVHEPPFKNYKKDGKLQITVGIAENFSSLID